jgi:serine/threonine protein kinase/tetratricopeptide (TPR) repeat protein
MGVVFRGVSTAEGPAGPAGSTVAVKVVHAHLVGEAHAFERFRREADIGRQIRHPHVVRTHDVGEAIVNGRPVHFMVMELIEGQTLSDLLEDLGTVPETLRFQIADQVLDALDAIHAKGVVHRDIKPENVVITPDHRVLIMDLGVARLQGGGHTLTETGQFVGSLAYASPEQFRAGDEAIDGRADVYAFGVVLFELATGKNPFSLDNLPTLLRQKLQGGVPAPKTVNGEVDAFWNEVILTATRIPPAERFANAADMRRVLQEGEAGDWWRARRAKAGVSVSDRALRRLRVDREAPLVGRSEALARLRAVWEKAKRKGSVLLLGGASGVGKSRLLYDFLEGLASAEGPIVAAGRGVGAGGRSYQPFVEALLDLLLPGEADPAQRRAALEARLSALLADTPGVVPHFAEFLLGGIQPGVEGAFSKDAVLATTARILQRVSAERPLVFVIEDLHQTGAESIELFRHLGRSVAEHPLLLVGVYADDEIEEGTPLHALSAQPPSETLERVALGPLDDAASEELVRAVVRTERTVRALARPLYERGDGNAFLVLETLAHLKAQGALVAKGDGLELSGASQSLAVPSTVRDLVGLKLSRLEEDQRETLEAAAILGYEFDAGLLAAVLGQNRIHLLKRLAGLERKQRLLVGSGKSAFRFAGRQIYETVYEGINPALRVEYHGLVADTILQGLPEAEQAKPTGANAYALLRHLIDAERASEAEGFLDAALDYVGRAFHASYAAPFVEKVAQAFADAPPARRLGLWMRLWTFYEILASRADQMRVIAKASEVADALGEPGPRARVHAYRAGSLWYAGDYEQAAAEARLGLDLARKAGDRKEEATCRHTLGAIAYRRGEAEAGAAEWREALRIRREIGDRRGEASTLQALALVMPSIGEDAQVLPTMQEALKAWREVGERRGEAAVLMNIGSRFVETARYEEGLRHLEQAIALHRETGALLSEATALANLGRAHEILGRVDAARASWERALRLFVDLQDPNGEIAVRVMLGGALGTYGETAEALEHLEKAADLAAKKGARAKQVTAHRELGRLLHGMGRRPEAWSHFEKALALEGEAKSVSGRVATLSEMGDAALGENDAARAVRYLDEALPGARKGDGATAVMVLCRLARAQQVAGRADLSVAYAREALERLEAGAGVSPAQGPEIYYTLGETLDGGARREEFRARARTMTEERAKHIRDDSHREHYLTRSWPNLRIGAADRGS